MKPDFKGIAAGIWPGLLRVTISIVAPLILAAILIQATGHDARTALAALWSGSTGIDFGPPMSFDGYTGARIVAEATPLLLCGLAVWMCLRAGLFNIGATGQMTAGAFVAAWVGGLLHPSGTGPSMLALLPLLTGCLAGGLCGAAAGWLKAYRNVHEVISTIMLNYVVIDIAQYFIANQLREPGSMAVQTPKLAPAIWLPPLTPAGAVNIGAVIALVALVVCAVVIAGTAFGFRVRALGAGPTAARVAGLPTRLTTISIMALAGMLAGIAGALQVQGVYHRCVTDVAGNYGFQAIAVALLAGASAPGLLLSSLFFGGLTNGATILQLQTGVPSSLVAMLQAVIIVVAAMRRFGPPRLPKLPAKPQEATP